MTHLRRYWPEAVATCIFSVGLAWYISRRGIPVAVYTQFAIIAVGLLTIGFRRLRAVVRGLFSDWLPFLLVLLVYDLIRGLADNWSAHHIHIALQINVDRTLVGVVPSVWLQEHLAPHLSGVVNDMFAVIYLSHFWLCLTVAAVLWWRSRDVFREFLVPYVVLTYTTLATYVAFPAAPPWLDSQLGFLPPTSRIVGTTLSHLTGMTSPTTDWGHQLHTLSNPVAAVPSLHAAYPLFLCLFFWHRLPRLRPLLVAYPLAMAFVLVYGAEHFVFDILLGWAYAVGAVALTSILREAVQATQIAFAHPVATPYPAPAPASSPVLAYN